MPDRVKNSHRLAPWFEDVLSEEQGEAAGAANINPQTTRIDKRPGVSRKDLAG
jgi:hypothetical protein